MKYLWKKVILAGLFVSFIYASAFEAGAVFLLIYPGAKATSLGGAFCAVADDATALYYNPSAIALQKKFQITLMHSPWLRGLAPDMYYEYIGITRPIILGSVGLGITYATYGLFEGQGPDGEYYGEWRPYDVAISAAYAYPVNERLNLGANVKFIYSFLAPAEILRRATGIEGGGKGASFAVGASMLYDIMNRHIEKSSTSWLDYRLRFGAALDNLGPGIKYSSSTDERDPLPRLLRMGLSFRLSIPYHSFTLAADINKVLVGIGEDYRDRGFKYVVTEAWKHIGFEYSFYNLLSMRIGYFLDEEGAREGITYGAGFHIGNFKLDVSDDHKIYSFDQGANLRYSLSYYLPLGKGKKSPDKKVIKNEGQNK